MDKRNLKKKETEWEQNPTVSYKKPKWSYKYKKAFTGWKCFIKKFINVNSLLLLQKSNRIAETLSLMCVFFLPLSECMEEVWKGDMGAKGGAEKAESESTEKEGAREEKEDKRHDGGELWRQEGKCRRQLNNLSFSAFGGQGMNVSCPTVSQHFLCCHRWLKPLLEFLIGVETL